MGLLDNVGDTYTVEVISVDGVTDIEIRCRKWTKDGVLESFSSGQSVEEAFGFAPADLDKQSRRNESREAAKK
jgi:hypothetical protein